MDVTREPDIFDLENATADKSTLHDQTDNGTNSEAQSDEAAGSNTEGHDATIDWLNDEDIYEDDQYHDNEVKPKELLGKLL